MSRHLAFRDKERQRFEAVFQTHRTVVLEGAGHCIQEDTPEEIAASCTRPLLRVRQTPC